MKELGIKISKLRIENGNQRLTVAKLSLKLYTNKKLDDNDKLLLIELLKVIDMSDEKRFYYLNKIL